jgi:hypothetical protein
VSAHTNIPEGFQNDNLREYNMADQHRIQFETANNLESLRKVAQLSNRLAKMLTGPARALAYRIKAEACSSLILAGVATVNGVWPGGILALDLFGSRLHVRRSHLTWEARQRLDHMAGRVPTVARLSEIYRRKN